MPQTPTLERSVPITPEDARAIARDAYVYGFPLVDSYRIQHSYFVDDADPEFKGAWNEVHNTARVYTPEDKAIQSPNSDTPYSFVGADLRAEPLVFTVPAVAGDRYYALQFIDAYTFDFAYVGTRSTGREAGSWLLAGPGWHGETPPGVKDVIRCETELAFVIYRTQLFGPDDLEAVKSIQAGYRVEPLSHFLGQPEPAAPAPIDFAKPLDREAEKTDPEFFELLNFVLGFCPTHPTETELMARFARLEIGAGHGFEAAKLAPELRQAVQAGMADAWAALADVKVRLDSGELKSGDLVGSRDYLKNNYPCRMAAAVFGIYGNAKEEAIYPTYWVDSDGDKPSGAARYRLRFAPDGLPPVSGFWSLTLYALPESLLYANPLDRYLINLPMLPGLARDADGGVTLIIQHEAPAAELLANWLPAPEGSFFLVMRLYAPKPAAGNGSWSAPPLRKADARAPR